MNHRKNMSSEAAYGRVCQKFCVNIFSVRRIIECHQLCHMFVHQQLVVYELPVWYLAPAPFLVELLPRRYSSLNTASSLGKEPLFVALRKLEFTLSPAFVVYIRMLQHLPVRNPHTVMYVLQMGISILQEFENLKNKAEQ